MKKKLLVGSTLLAVVLATTGHAEAKVKKVWVQIDGCAVDIAVGGLDVPWAIDCSPSRGLWFRDPKGTCSGNVCLPAWRSADAGANFVSLDVGGKGVYVTDGAGALWVAMWQNGNKNLKPNMWVKPPTFMPSGAAGCMTSFAAGKVLADFWAIGCGGNPNAPIWLLDPVWVSQQVPNIFAAGTNVWHQQGAQFANAASRISLFNAHSGNSVSQNPWALAGGSVWAFNGSYFDWVPAPSDGQVTAVTDHYIVSAGSVYRWNGNIFGGGGGATPWTFEIGPTPAPIKSIAWSTNYPGLFPATSRLWAVDTSGNIYYEFARVEPG